MNTSIIENTLDLIFCIPLVILQKITKFFKCVQEAEKKIEKQKATAPQYLLEYYDLPYRYNETVVKIFFWLYCSLNIKIKIETAPILMPVHNDWIIFVTKHGLMIIGTTPTNWMINESKIITLRDLNFVTKKSANGFQKIPIIP